MSDDEDHIAMAAEYVLGTLDGEERAQVETMMSADPQFKQLVEQWERRLGELHAMVGAVEPADEVWSKIRTAVTAITPEAAMRLPEVASTPAAAATATVHEIRPDNANAPLTARGRRWRGLAQLTTALAACLAGFIAVQAYRPDLLPEQWRPEGKTEYVEVQPPAPAQFVAVLQRDGGPPAFIMTIDTAAKEFTVRKAGPDAPAGRAYELWMVSDKFPQPRSLGVIGPTDFTVKPVSGFEKETIHAAIYAVTVEPEGGSPTGAPTSAPIYAGKLIETVPAASTPPAKR